MKEDKPQAPRRGGRALARYRVVQLLYAWHQGGAAPWDEAAVPCAEDEPQGDTGYAAFLLARLAEDAENMRQQMDEMLDRPAAALDPVEYCIIMLGICELKYSTEIPVAVIIDEAVRIAKLLAGTDGYKYINASLDKIATRLREQ